MVFKWFLNGFLNGILVPLIVTSRTSRAEAPLKIAEKGGEGRGGGGEAGAAEGIFA